MAFASDLVLVLRTTQTNFVCIAAFASEGYFALSTSTPPPPHVLYLVSYTDDHRFCTKECKSAYSDDIAEDGPRSGKTQKDIFDTDELRGEAGGDGDSEPAKEPGGSRGVVGDDGGAPPQESGAKKSKGGAPAAGGSSKKGRKGGEAVCRK